MVWVVFRAGAPGCFLNPGGIQWLGRRHGSPFANAQGKRVTQHAPTRHTMREAVIASSVRTAVGKAFKGTLRATRPDDLAALAMQEAIRRVPGLNPNEIEDVILGCAMPEFEQGMNVAHNVALRAGLPVEVPAITRNRFCSSGLQTIAMSAERIMAGHR